jgi:hypothetical protein
MSKFWDWIKRELRGAIQRSGRPDLVLAVISGMLAWGLVSALRAIAAAFQNG